MKKKFKIFGLIIIIFLIVLFVIFCFQKNNIISPIPVSNSTSSTYQTIEKLNENQLIATVVEIPACPPCPKNLMCKPCFKNYIIVLDQSSGKKIKLYITFGSRFQLNKKYKITFEINQDKDVKNIIEYILIE